MNKNKDLSKKFFYLVFMIVSFACLYSWALMDPNFTLLSHPLWDSFRNLMVRLGYEQKNFSILFFLLSTGGLYWLYKQIFSQTLPPMKIAIMIGFVTLFSYPAFSHDLFNYLFDAKIITIYHANPYIFPPQHFVGDHWLRFMHWIHRTYPYGPTFLPLSLVPVFLASGKLFFSFIFYKLVQSLFYLLGVFSLSKIDKKSALIFALHPIVIIEGLINVHNDLIAVGIGLAGIWLMIEYSQSKTKKYFPISILLLILGGLIKYISLPTIFSLPKKRLTQWIGLTIVLGLITYLSITQVTQPWYFLNLFLFLPYFPSLIEKFEIFFAGLMLSYYPYVLQTGWADPSSVKIKNNIIFASLLLNIAWLCFQRLKSRNFHLTKMIKNN